MTRGLWFVVVVTVLHVLLLSAWAWATVLMVQRGHVYIALTACVVVWADAPQLYRMLRHVVRGVREC